MHRHMNQIPFQGEIDKEAERSDGLEIFQEKDLICKK